MSDLTSTLDSAAAFDYFSWRVTIESVVRTDDDYGSAQDETWTAEFEDLQCRVEPTGDASREMRRKDGTVAVNARYVRFRHYHPDIESNMRAVIEGDVYDILGVDHDPQKAHTRLIVEKVS